MLTKFFFMLREGGLKPSITELLTLLQAMKSGLADQSTDDFYYLARSCLVKDESKFDCFDKIFAAHFAGIEDAFKTLITEVPEEWFCHQVELNLSEEERAEIEALGGFEKIIDRLRELLEEQEEKHKGGNKWIGTTGTSPFGAYGYNPEGIRIGRKHGRVFKIVRVIGADIRGK